MAGRKLSEIRQEVIYLSSAEEWKWYSDGARDWLSFYFNQPKSSKRLPTPIRRWISFVRRNARMKKVLADPFCHCSAGKQLIIRFAQDDPRQPLLLLTEVDLTKSKDPGEIGKNGQPGLHRLTVREREVLQWISLGKTNSEIAVILKLSQRTVDKHVQNIFRKLQVKSRVEATLCVVKQSNRR